MYKNLFIKLLFFLLLISCQVLKPKSFLLKSNQEKALHYSRNIKASELKKHLYILASDAFEGRETTTPGQKKAAKYIEEHFKNTKVLPALDSTYFQEFIVDVADFSNVELNINGKKLKFLKD